MAPCCKSQKSSKNQIEISNNWHQQDHAESKYEIEKKKSWLSYPLTTESAARLNPTERSLTTTLSSPPASAMLFSPPQFTRRGILTSPNVHSGRHQTYTPDVTKRTLLTSPNVHSGRHQTYTPDVTKRTLLTSPSVHSSRHQTYTPHVTKRKILTITSYILKVSKFGVLILKINLQCFCNS